MLQAQAAAAAQAQQAGGGRMQGGGMPPPAAPGVMSEAKLAEKAKKWQQLQTKRLLTF